MDVGLNAVPRLDLAPMYRAHDTLRDDLRRLAEVPTCDDPRALLQTAADWDLFKDTLHAHLSTEDEVLWPALRAHPAIRSEERALLTALEAEHCGVSQVIEAIDILLAESAGCLDQLRDLLDALVTGLHSHLTHEETAALPLVRALAAPAQWDAFTRLHAERVSAVRPQATVASQPHDR